MSDDNMVKRGLECEMQAAVSRLRASTKVSQNGNLRFDRVTTNSCRLHLSIRMFNVRDKISETMLAIFFFYCKCHNALTSTKKSHPQTISTRFKPKSVAGRYHHTSPFFSTFLASSRSKTTFMDDRCQDVFRVSTTSNSLRSTLRTVGKEQI